MKTLSILQRSSLVTLLILFTVHIACDGQSGTGSMNNYNSVLCTAPSDSSLEYAETLCIGPNAQLEINGVFIVYSTHVWIASTAQFSGNGKIIFADPSVNLFYPARPALPTQVDGNNGNFVNVDLVVANPENIILADVPDPGYSTTNPAGVLAATFKIDKTLSLEANDGHVLLNGHDLVFGPVATIHNFAPSRMIVTGNSATGHVVKLNNTPTSFVFPVGIAEGDYTPATISGANSYHVSVTDYNATSAHIDAPQEGIYRTWHIYGGTANSIQLQHNTVTNGTDYSDTLGFITQYLGAPGWSSASVPDFVSAGVHNNTITVPAALVTNNHQDGAWLTKTSDPLTPLPVKLLRFEASVHETTLVVLDWATSEETNNLNFEIERSTDGIQWTRIGTLASKAARGNSQRYLEYRFNDSLPVHGTNFYRLKQIDHTRQYSYSKIKQVVFSRTSGSVQIYPNPFTDQVHITNLQGKTSILLRSASGTTLYQISEERDTILNLGHLTHGVYFLHLTSDDTTVTEKIVK